jgi:hypothetical protein
MVGETQKMIPIQPNAEVMEIIDELVVETNSGRVFRNGIEVAISRGWRRKINIKVHGVQSGVFISHIIWYKKTDKWPMLELHHKNEDNTDDRFDNLEEVTHEQNCFYSKRSQLPIGIQKRDGKYRARLCQNGKVIHIGFYKTIEEAVKARGGYNG